MELGLNGNSGSFKLVGGTSGWHMENLSKGDVNAAIRKRTAGRFLLSSFLMRRPEKEALIKGAIADVVSKKMLHMLPTISYEVSMGEELYTGETLAQPLKDRQGKIVMGITAVQLGYDPEGSERVSDPVIQESAELAASACYFTTLTGQFDDEHIARRYRQLLAHS